ncbi:MAG TPA: hypothetical protein VFV67_22455 [Actinophytocola sp.]|uniref:DUF7737 domain-containing protein n=1 Tax=Actinophytocola sp. TaxID=1872138 RepID=UPI002DBE4EB1|nr:hypothetical protein [Actinophytocola sp.]HEU5473415.1 hypothetical protein [Actinophytocola sp.]
MGNTGIPEPTAIGLTNRCRSSSRFAADDRYLCIVPSRRRDPKVLLPFEGDEVLSVILSEVLLLVRDDRITDPTILSQLAIRPAR